jgi:hypothetical protein
MSMSARVTSVKSHLLLECCGVNALQTPRTNIGTVFNVVSGCHRDPHSPRIRVCSSTFPLHRYSPFWGSTGTRTLEQCHACAARLATAPSLAAQVLARMLGWCCLQGASA